MTARQSQVDIEDGSVQIYDTPITAEILERIRSLSQISTLIVARTEIPPELAAIIADSRGSLGLLGFSETNVSDEMIGAIGNAPELEELQLDSCPGITERVCEHFHLFPKLFSVSFDSSTFTPRGLELLRHHDEQRGVHGMAPIQSFCLFNGPVSREMTEIIARFESIWNLRLERTDLTDDAILPLAAMRSVVDLSLQENAAVTADGVLSLSSMPKVENLDLVGTGVSKDVFTRLGAFTKLLYLHWCSRSSAESEAQGLQYFYNFPGYSYINDHERAMADLRARTIPTIHEPGLTIAGTGYTSAALKLLAGERILKWLCLHGVEMLPGELGPLATIPLLEEVYYSHSSKEYGSEGGRGGVILS